MLKSEFQKKKAEWSPVGLFVVFFACVYLERAVDLLEQNGAKHLMRKGELGKRHQFGGAAPHSFRKSERPA